MSDSVWPHRQQPTRLLCLWDSPGKNTGVGCHFLLQCMHAWLIISVMSDSVWLHRQQPIRLLYLWDSPGKNTGVGCHFLLQIPLGYGVKSFHPWIQFTSVHRNFASMFKRETGLYFSCGIRGILASSVWELGSTLSSFIFWNNLRNIGVYSF